MKQARDQAELSYLAALKERDEAAVSLLGTVAPLLGERGRAIADHILATGEFFPPAELQQMWDSLSRDGMSVDTAFTTLSRCSTLGKIGEVYNTDYKLAVEDLSQTDALIGALMAAVQGNLIRRAVSVQEAQAQIEKDAQQQGAGPLWPKAVGGMFDLLQGLRRGQMYVLAGEKKTGKSTLTLQMATSCALNGLRVVVYAIDMGLERTVEIVRQVAGDNFPWVDMQVVSMPTTTAELRADALHFATQKVDLAIVDQLQQVRSSRNVRSREEEVSEASSVCVEVARRLNCVVWACSQLSYEGRMRHSGQIEYDAAAQLSLKKSLSGDYKLHIETNRFAPEPSGGVALYRTQDGLFHLQENRYD